ncbi:Aste57867_14983 [Aphanomyces stellatus]|uniref:Aste57867_14983 protein n=1 Tax=Aphanomyces stellatus TaxID=120398 RepID=A0A485L2Y5_9STRA|nr:hypothetical protein As57867_014927 [Aphanomyces stellatus]VFT91797.1 Aste57867_14983 [Aphanomyces stellatus]
MAEAHRLIASDKPEDAATLKALFNPCFDNTNDTEDNRGTFERQLFMKFQGIAQYNYVDATGSSSLSKVCAAFADVSISPVEKLSRFVNNRGGDNCTYNRFEGYVEYYKNVTVAPEAWSRQWFYQTCAEFGFGQTTASGHGAFSPLKFGTIDVVQHKLCDAVFGIKDGDARAAATIKTYGGLKIDVENVVFSSGTIDPWTGLSLTNATGTVNAKSQVIDIEGTSHCRDMDSREPTDSGHLVWAHQRIEAAVDGFLRNKC